MNEIDLRDGHKDDDVVAVVAAAALDSAADDLGLVRLELAMGTTMDTKSLDAVLAAAIRTMRAAGKALAGGAAVIALALAGLMLPGASPHAAAATVAVEAPQPDPAPVLAQHPTRFGRGTWQDACAGFVYVAAPLTELVGNLGWLPSPFARVVVQERTARGIRTRVVLMTDTDAGVARGVVRLGGGVHIVRVVHFADAWTLGTVGTWRRVVVTTEPCDIV